jgi:hypothetical protein
MACAARSWRPVSTCSQAQTCEGSPLPYNTIGAFTNDILDIVLFRHIEGNLPGASASCWRHGGVVCGEGRCCCAGGLDGVGLLRGVWWGRWTMAPKSAQYLSVGRLVEEQNGRRTIRCKTEDVSFAFPGGFGRSHGETVGRYDTGRGPTLVCFERRERGSVRRAASQPAMKAAAAAATTAAAAWCAEDKEGGLLAARRLDWGCKETCSHTNGSLGPWVCPSCCGCGCGGGCCSRRRGTRWGVWWVQGGHKAIAERAVATAAGLWRGRGRACG